MRFISVPQLTGIFYPQIIKSFPTAKGKLFFTFDDGPDPEVTPNVLEILKQYKAKATFFCIGENVEKNIEKTEKTINSHIFRPPYGKLKPSQYYIIKKKYKIILWDVMSYDFDQSLTAEQCAQIVIKNARDGSILVFHDTQKAKERLLLVLPKLLEYYIEKGYQFDKIDVLK